VRAKKARKRPRSIRSKNASRAASSVRAPRAMRPWAIVLGLICVMAAGALIAARQPIHRGDVASVDTQPEGNAPRETVGRAAQLEAKKTLVPKGPATAAVAKAHMADASTERTPAVESVNAVAVESASKAPAAESTSEGDVQNLAPITITGCLELDNGTFRLRDTSGVDAPRSRSWRSGFLKKRPSPIELVDAVNTLRLSTHVGQRVAATGMLTNREMRARSLQQVGASCS
jgi:hypothetical protein